MGAYRCLFLLFIYARWFIFYLLFVAKINRGGNRAVWVIVTGQALPGGH